MTPPTTVTERPCTCGKPPEGVSHDPRCPAHDPATCRICRLLHPEEATR